MRKKGPYCGWFRKEGDRALEDSGTVLDRVLEGLERRG
jgi:hypothetical protein